MSNVKELRRHGHSSYKAMEVQNYDQWLAEMLEIYGTRSRSDIDGVWMEIIAERDAARAKAVKYGVPSHRSNELHPIAGTPLNVVVFVSMWLFWGSCAFYHFGMTLDILRQWGIIAAFIGFSIPIIADIAWFIYSWVQGFPTPYILYSGVIIVGSGFFLIMGILVFALVGTDDEAQPAKHAPLAHFLAVILIAGFATAGFGIYNFWEDSKNDQKALLAYAEAAFPARENLRRELEGESARMEKLLLSAEDSPERLKATMTEFANIAEREIAATVDQLKPIKPPPALQNFHSASLKYYERYLHHLRDMRKALASEDWENVSDIGALMKADEAQEILDAEKSLKNSGLEFSEMGPELRKYWENRANSGQ